MAATPSPKCSLSCNSSALLFFQSLCSSAQISNACCCLQIPPVFQKSGRAKNVGGFENCGGYDEGWKPMVTRRRKDVCFPGPTQNPPPHPTSWKPANKVPCLLKRQKGQALLRMQLAITDV